MLLSRSASPYAGDMPMKPRPIAEVVRVPSVLVCIGQSSGTRQRRLGPVEPGTESLGFADRCIGDNGLMDREALAEFLRLRRNAIKPADVGLPPGVRRRTAGLRREEVAQLTGMSVDYYGRLEQARSTQP